MLWMLICILFYAIKLHYFPIFVVSSVCLTGGHECSFITICTFQILNPSWINLLTFNLQVGMERKRSVKATSLPLNKLQGVWSARPVWRMIFTTVTPGVKPQFESSVTFDHFGCRRENQSSRQEGEAGWRSKSCNHVWRLILGSGECQCDGSDHMGHTCFKYCQPLLIQPWGVGRATVFFLICIQ